jgi:hypothetical protein
MTASIRLVVLLLAASFPAAARAASCCGGGGGGASVLPRGATAMLDLGGDLERYDGYWDTGRVHLPDPPGARLAQTRLNLTGAVRLASDWQAAATLPYAWNDNVYAGAGRASHTRGPGDATLSAWYEAWSERSAWRVAGLSDLLPSITLGPTLTIPTGVSPYDQVTSSFDVTGRGFYRLDATVLLDKSYRAWSASLSVAYGRFFERPINRLDGHWVEPYRKRLGDRASIGGSLGHRSFLGMGGTSLALAVAISWLQEARGTIAGAPDPATGMERASLTGTLTWAGTDEDWSARLSWNHAVQRDGWGRNFPTTDIYSLGVRYVRP